MTTNNNSDGHNGWHPEDLKMFKFLRGIVNQIDIAYISTYPPQECGIATFTRDLSSAIEKYTPFSNPMVVAVTGNVETQHFPSIVKYQINKENHQSYIDAADMINRSDIWGVSLQHEYGIFGGRDGEYILDFLDRLTKPIVTTLHTVLFDPGENQKRIVQRIAEMSCMVVVMVKIGKDMLINTYGIPESDIAVIPHGVPNVNHQISIAAAKKSLGIINKHVLSTFGLISRGKGIEYALKAMPGILEKHPDTIYMVLGETHPGVRNNEGESYRKELLQIVQDLGIENNVRFNNKYLTMDELIQYLSATDIYITPYI
ncbi:MAG: glycosyltransferase, partial [Armatimonadota bacterium]